MPTALFIHHDANSEVGLLGDSARSLGFEVVEHFICDDLDSGVASREFPSLDGVDLLVLLGSRWSVYDEANTHTWLSDEVALIGEAHRRGTATLGVCFGGQILAHALGGHVRPAEREEIGWVDITVDAGNLDDAAQLGITTGPWFQWHLDVFDPPEHAQVLAHSPVGAQAFRLGNAVALQFHPEVNRAVLESWMISDRDQLVACGVDPDGLLTTTDAMGDAPRQRCDALLTAVVEALSEPNRREPV